MAKVSCHRCTLPPDTTLKEDHSYVMIHDVSDPTETKEYCAEVQVLNCQVMLKKSEMFKCEVCLPGFRFVDHQCKPFRCATPSDVPHR